jgi:hypothetical protein
MSDTVLANILREFESELSSPPFFGIPLGAALSEALHRYLFIYSPAGGQRPPPLGRWLSRARVVRHRLRPRQSRPEPSSVPVGRILVTWFACTPRYNELITPILAQLDEQSYAVIHEQAQVASCLQPGVAHVQWEQILQYDVKTWRAEYKRCRPQWDQRLRRLCSRFDLADGTYEYLSLSLMVASQRVSACLGWLERTKPTAVLTEYDRNHLWSCLILAARHLGIPTATLVHGVMDRNALAFSPVVADTVLCWGEMDRAKLLAAGEPPDTIVMAGCPRLTRDLSATREQGRAKLGLDPLDKVVMYVSTPEPQSPELVELFCQGIDRAEGVSALVRLHPSEDLADFESSATRHPHVRFSENAQSTVDEALAAVDLVVTSGSGMGSDALVKGRPVIVLNPGTVYRGADLDLVERGACPHARNPEELASIVVDMLGNEDLRAEKAEGAERYAVEFCAAYGADSARRIASFITQAARRALL